MVRSKRNSERSLVETGIRLAFSIPGVVGDLGVTGVSILAQALLDEMACRPSLSPHPLCQRAVGYNFCLGWCA
jgi:hypothetical protein